MLVLGSKSTYMVLYFPLLLSFSLAFVCFVFRFPASGFSRCFIVSARTFVLFSSTGIIFNNLSPLIWR